MGEDSSNEYDLEMVDVEDPVYSSGDEDFDTTDSEYGEADSQHERTLTPNIVTANSSAAKADFYRTSMRRQNICFGSTVFLVVGMFIAAYFYMDISFSPSNVGIFGDELAMKGASGEVGLDADNAETQQIIDEEIIELEETGQWGENAKEVRSKIDDIIFDKDRIGEHEWVEDSNWWKDNIGNMDVSVQYCTTCFRNSLIFTLPIYCNSCIFCNYISHLQISNMTKKEAKAYKQIMKKEERRKKKNKKEEEKNAKAAKKGKVGKPEKKEGFVGDIDDIKQKLANRHHDSHGEKNKLANDLGTIDDIYREKRKHNGPRPDDWSRGKNRDKGNEINDEGDGKDEEDTSDTPLNDEGDGDVEEINTAETIEEPKDTEELNDGADGEEEPEEAAEIQKETRNYDIDNDTPEENTNTAGTNEQVDDTEDGNERGNDKEEQDDTTEATNKDGVDGGVPAEEETNEAETNEQVEDTDEGHDGELAVATISTAYTVLEQETHDSMSFTQGISYCSDGKIYETTGLYGQSKVRRINPDTFEVEKSIDTPREFFGEGSTCFIGRDGKEYLIEITWREHRGFVYEVPSLELLHSFDYTTTAPAHQGWGITYDPKKHELIVSDGSEYLYFWDIENFETKRKVAVTRFDGRKQTQINELEFMDGLVCYNIWHEDDIICADPETGKSVREYGE
eukprot:scaffold967_cov148-Skeletonema_menzelii.AAC.5